MPADAEQSKPVITIVAGGYVTKAKPQETTTSTNKGNQK